MDVSNIRTVIHFGPNADIDDYFQESGRAGCDGIESNAILYYYPGCLMSARPWKRTVKVEDSCRRKELLKHLIGGLSVLVIGDVKHNCCDICTNTCDCTTDCPLQSIATDNDDDEVEEPVRVITQSECDQLIQSAHEQCAWQPVYAGLDLVCGLPSSMVDTVVDNCEYFSGSFDVEEKCLVWNWAADIY